MNIKKVKAFFLKPFRLIKKFIGDWINNSSHLSADWIRRHNLEQFKLKNSNKK
jgi:hypothetical protein